MKELGDETHRAGRAPSGPGSADNETTGLPGFRTWRGVYLFVIGCFILCVIFLAALKWAFS